VSQNQLGKGEGNGRGGKGEGRGRRGYGMRRVGWGWEGRLLKKNDCQSLDGVKDFVGTDILLYIFKASVHIHVTIKFKTHN